ncbi:MAG: hypothetical protein ACKOX3_06610 [Bacteroidota bacterium]
MEPFALYLKKYFHANPHLGARDRRNVRHLCYAWWRLGKAGTQLSENERMAIAFFLSYQDNDKFSQRFFKNDYLLNSITEPINLKWEIVVKQYDGLFSLSDVFPFQSLIETSINTHDFVLDGFNRRKLWTRINRHDKQKVLDFFYSENVPFRISDVNEFAMQLPDDYDIINALPFQNGWLEVQDLSSQLLGSWYRPIDGQKWLDACAASGGKSLQLLDRNNNIDLTVTDIRESILKNLNFRFKRNNTRFYQSAIVDWSNPQEGLKKIYNEQFDAVIADVPCSGSGTWARSPEHKNQITEDKINAFSDLQFTISSNLIPTLKKGGSLFYSTCSVYQTENHLVVDRLIKHFSLELIQSKIIDGSKSQADTMFVAELKKQ